MVGSQIVLCIFSDGQSEFLTPFSTFLDDRFAKKSRASPCNLMINTDCRRDPS
jgi:hypothetical protein